MSFKVRPPLCCASVATFSRMKLRMRTFLSVSVGPGPLLHVQTWRRPWLERCSRGWSPDLAVMPKMVSQGGPQATQAEQAEQRVPSALPVLLWRSLLFTGVPRDTFRDKQLSRVTSRAGAAHARSARAKDTLAFCIETCWAKKLQISILSCFILCYPILP